MESAYNNHHHLQDQLVVVGSSSSSSILSSAATYGLGTTTHAWGTTTTPTTSFIMNTNNNNIPSPSSHYAAAPEFHSWANTDGTDDFGSSQLLMINKDDFSNHNYYRKYADLLNATTQQDSCSKIFSAGDLMYGGGGGRGNIMSQIFPTINGGSSSSNLDMNLEALDLLTSSSFSGNNYSQNYPINGIFRDHHHAFTSNYAAQQPQQQVPLYEEDDTSYKISSAPGIRGSRRSVETKRSSNKIEPKPPFLKKSRIEARTSCPPFKVTKEKLGDRIATLQQLVAPFGKTDTASVLMEAIGYIKFLQDQVETLSVPYMKASRNKSTRSIQEGIVENQKKTDGESKRDLRSRGLCLVPLSCLSYITDGGAAVVWPPPHFGGGPT